MYLPGVYNSGALTVNTYVQSRKDDAHHEKRHGESNENINI